MSALEDLAVLDLTDEKGQLMGKLLADMGAYVVKVEPPGGDPARRTGPFAGDGEGRERSLYWWQFNTSKRSVTLDITRQEGQKLLQRLANRADILLESFQPGYLDSLGLGYEALSALNPRLVYTSLTGFGQTGPYRDFLTSDVVALAMGGTMASCGYDDVTDAPPIAPRGYHGYSIGCHWGLIGTLVALHHRDQTGRGQRVDASVHEAVSCTTEAAMPWYFYQRKVPMRQTGRHHAVRPTPKNQLPAADGKFIMAWAVPRTPRHWESLIGWLAQHGEERELVENPHIREVFLSAERGAPEEVHRVWAAIARMIAKLPSDEVFHEAQKRGYPWGIVRPPEEVLADPHFQERGFFVPVEHPEDGRAYLYPRAPYVFSQTPWRIRRRAPHVGEDNREVYIEWLGLAPEELEALRSQGVV
ncbi:MAG: CoA transferase [Chloroflexi bacterium]|nr:CoA transferase [Chloroflexota bacterium]